MAKENGSSANAVVAVVSLLLVGVATFFVVKALKKPTPIEDGMPETPETPPKKKSGKVVVGELESLGIGDKPKFNLLDNILNAFKSGSFTKTSSDISGFSFPIKKGQSGSNVKKLQLLLLQYDKNILPKYGADSDFGTETESALIKILGKGVVSSNDDIEMIKAKGIQKGLSFLSANPLAPLGVTIKR
jgi:hypothetical protein